MKIKLNPISIVLLTLSVSSIAAQNFIPQLTLAQEYQVHKDYTGYWMSEKLDGIRAFWTGTELLTRNGNKIAAPTSFTYGLPNQALEGELWAGRGNFHLVQQTVLDEIPNAKAWARITFMLFDIPGAVRPFDERIASLKTIVATSNNPQINVVPHSLVSSNVQIVEKLDEIERQGGEGVMLRVANALYKSGRSNTLIKLKSYSDAEAMVIGYKAGKGKYSGMMGSIIVESAEGLQFLIGSGFTDSERENPPPIGTKINFRYNGKTQNGVPKFARYIKVRED
jgi:DNA ligase-1